MLLGKRVIGGAVESSNEGNSLVELKVLGANLFGIFYDLR